MIRNMEDSDILVAMDGVAVSSTSSGISSTLVHVPIHVLVPLPAGRHGVALVVEALQKFRHAKALVGAGVDVDLRARRRAVDGQQCDGASARAPE